MSFWAERNVIPKIAGQPHVSEQEALSRFLGVLKTNKGNILSGWNIGYDVKPQGQAAGSGFDIPFILTRAGKYGMGQEFSAAFQAMKIRDVAHETLFQLAPLVVKHGEHVDEDLLAQMQPVAGAAKTIRNQLINQGLAGEDLIQEGARRLYSTGMSVAGWKLGQMHELMGLGSFDAHNALEDIKATRNIFTRGALQDSPEFIQEWNKGALLNRLLKAGEFGAYRPEDREGHFTSLMSRAERFGISNQFLSQLKEQGLDVPSVRQGFGLDLTRTYKYVPNVEALLDKAARRIGESKWSRYKLPLGIAAGLTGLYMLKPLSLFSGKDDAYNSIEGLRHGGLAEVKRKGMTEFGSGYIGNLFGGIKNFLRASRSEVKTKIKQDLKNVFIDTNPIAASMTAGLAGGYYLNAYKPVRQRLLGLFPVGDKYPVQRMIIANRAKFRSTVSNILGIEYDPKILPTQLVHELSETIHAKRQFERRGFALNKLYTLEEGISLAIQNQPTFSSHYSSAVIADEMLYAAKMGSEYFQALKKFRFAELDILVKEGREPAYINRTRKMYTSFEKKWLPKFQSKIPGSDDAYNIIEGLPHGGHAEVKRKELTEFGSGWDKLRALFNIKSEKAFNKLIGSTKFQKALARGRAIKEIGRGGFGVAHLMETELQVGGFSLFGKQIGGRKEKFQFVRKTINPRNDAFDVDWEDVMREGATMHLLQDLNAPSLYGMKRTLGYPNKNFDLIPGKAEIFMEYFEGRSAQRVMLEGKQLPRAFIEDLKQYITKMHERGVVHIDILRDVSRFLGPDAKGMSEFIPHNVILTKEGRAGVIDYGLSSSTNTITAMQESLMRSFSRVNFATAKDFDMALVKSLEKHEGKLSAEASKKIRDFEHPELATTERTPGKHAELLLGMAQAQKVANAQLFENARNGGKRSKSVHAASSVPTPNLRR